MDDALKAFDKNSLQCYTLLQLTTTANILVYSSDRTSRQVLQSISSDKNETDKQSWTIEMSGKW